MIRPTALDDQAESGPQTDSPDLLDYNCTENEQDAIHLAGKYTRNKGISGKETGNGK
jgi:hypothetical protein